jgi:hypothetical protein
MKALQFLGLLLSSAVLAYADDDTMVPEDSPPAPQNSVHNLFFLQKVTLVVWLTNTHSISAAFFWK